MNTSVIKKSIKDSVDSLINELIDTLAERDYYDEIIENLRSEGVEIPEVMDEPSELLVNFEEVDKMKEILTNWFTKRFNFPK